MISTFQNPNRRCVVRRLREFRDAEFAAKTVSGRQVAVIPMWVIGGSASRSRLSTQDEYVREVFQQNRSTADVGTLPVRSNRNHYI